MNLYINKRTGAELLTLCEIGGEDWEKVEPKKIEPKQEVPKEPKKTTRRARK